MPKFTPAPATVILALVMASPALAQNPQITAVTNAASNAASYAPGLPVSIFGQNLAAASKDCIAAKVPTECSGVTVTIGGRAAPVRYVNPAVVLAYIPVETPLGTASLIVERKTDTQVLRSPPFTLTVETYAPALYSFSDPKTGRAYGVFEKGAGELINAANPAPPGDTLVAAAVGLGPTDPVVPAGEMGVARTLTLPRLFVGGREAQVQSSGMGVARNFSEPGAHLVRFTVPADTPAGDQPAYIETGGKKSNTVLLPVAEAKPAITAVIDAFSGQSTVAPGAWVEIYGRLLSTRQREWSASDFAGAKLPTSLEGVSVKVNGKSAAVCFVSPGQVNALIPLGTAEGNATVELTSSLGTAATTVKVQPIAPYFVLYRYVENAKYVAGVFPDRVYAGKKGLFAEGGPATRPARAGDTVLLFGAGFGLTDPAAPDAELLPAPLPLKDPGQLTIRIGGVAADVAFAGLAGPGLYQFNVVVPRTPGGDQPIVATIGGFSTQAGKFITLEGTPLVTGIINSASYVSGFVSPGALAQVAGSNWPISGTASSSGVPQPALDGTSVFVNGQACPLSFVSSTQINLQLPFSLTPGPAMLEVEFKVDGQAVRSLPFAFTLETYSPGIFTSAGDMGAFLDGATYAAISAQRQAKPGGVVIAYATGLGPTNPVVPAGTVTPNVAPATVTQPKVTVADRECQVLFSGLALSMVGLYQVNLRLPAELPAGNQQVVLEIGGKRSKPVLLPVGS
jgi:uncharacterized protein (TIGR03437 family)